MGYLDIRTPKSKLFQFLLFQVTTLGKDSRQEVEVEVDFMACMAQIPSVLVTKQISFQDNS